MDSRVPTSKCAEGVQNNGDAPVETRSASAFDVPKKVVSTERSVVLPPVFESNLRHSAVQVEIVRINGVCTMDLIKSLIGMVRKLCGEVGHLKHDNACLKEQLKNLQDAIQARNLGH
jgi:hypothetical protein